MNKYRAQPEEVEGYRMDSKKEANYFREILIRRYAHKTSERIVRFEVHPIWNIEINGIKICRVELDFTLEYGDGRIEYVDVKGVDTPISKLKRKLLKAVHGIDVTIV